MPRPCKTFRKMLIFLRWWVVWPSPNPQAGWPPHVGCPRLLIQYICSYPTYLEAVSSTLNLRTCHAVVTVSLDSCLPNPVLVKTRQERTLYTRFCTHVELKSLHSHTKNAWKKKRRWTTRYTSYCTSNTLHFLCVRSKVFQTPFCFWDRNWNRLLRVLHLVFLCS